jgi:hypothetical protein
MAEVYAANGNRMDRRDKPPGLTLAEALGIEVPANAPGGARIAAPSIRMGHRAGFDAWATSEEYEGFSDPDGWTKAR